MSFKEIIGQDGAVTFLKKAYSSQRLAHAYIFVGPDGVGKRTTALKFAQLLVCEDRDKKDEPCQKCPACVKAANLSHPDIQWVNAEGQFVKIDAVRQASRRLSLKGFESQYKVLIVPEAQCLNDESSNALLKTLEEPSTDTVIILIAPTLKKLLPTITSRCQRVVFSALDNETLGKILQEKFAVP
ncbi:MAG TPA: DNA polymerase III subunit delta', partial [Candidatus Omnitrophota bacterium]|nr:DNA polymerase III subunit delta' [Candidatus Omnitrophota bacterium]